MGEPIGVGIAPPAISLGIMGAIWLLYSLYQCWDPVRGNTLPA
jgi:hypothetical protein